MFGNKRLLDEGQLRKYASELKTKTDDQFVEEVRKQVYDAALLVRHSVHDQKATKCWEESERRKKPWLYQRGYNGAVRDAGEKPTAFDMERATEEHYSKEAA